MRPLKQTDAQLKRLNKNIRKANASHKEVSMPKIIDSYWFTGLGMLGCVGIILVKDQDTGKKKVFIGSAFGQNQEQDERFIIENGTKLTPEFLQKISDFLK